LVSDANLFDFLAFTNINNLSIYNSDLNVASLAYVSSDSNVKSGSIYNNVFRDFNSLETFVYAPVGRFNVDFNNSLNIDNFFDRSLFFIDDSNATGGNLWLNSLGDNVCSLDSESPLGICDSSITILGSNENYFDYLPLKEYIINIDLIPSSLSLSNNFIYGNSVTLTLDYNNIGNTPTSSDYNITFYYDNGSQVDLNYQLGATLNSDENSNASYIWDVNVIGDINICAIIEYSGDYNSNNDSICNEVHSYYRDLNFVWISTEFQIYDMNYYPLDINIYNAGDYNSNDFNVTLIIYEAENHNNNVSYSWNNQSIDANSVLALQYNWYPNFAFLADLNVFIDTSENDYNYLNNFYYLSPSSFVFFFDPILSDVNYSDANVGDIIDVNCYLDKNVFSLELSEIYDDLNVLFYVNNSLEDFNDDFDVNVLTFSYYLTSAQDYNFACEVEYAHDYDLTNNYDSNLITILSDSNVDLGVYDIRVNSTTLGTTANAYCDINNFSDYNAVDDYNVLFYINDVLSSSSLVSTDLNSGYDNSLTFSWVPTSEGTYSLRCDVDYNVNSFTGFDADLDNNSRTESFTITTPSNDGPGPGPDPDDTYNLKVGSIGYSSTLSKINSPYLVSTITKTGTLDASSSDLTLYINNQGSLEELDSVTISSYPYQYNKQVSLEDLLSINEDLNQLTDSSGKLEFILELDVSDDDSSDNNKSLKLSLNYFDSEIKNMKLKQGSLSNEISGNIDFDVTKKYSLTFDLYYTSINKYGSIYVTGKNSTENKVFFNKVYGMGSNYGKTINKSSVSVPITILDLMSLNDAKQVIADSLGGSLSIPEVSEKVDEIISSLGGASLSESMLNKIYFSGMSNELEISISGDDFSSNDEINFDFDYFSSEEISLPDDENSEDNNSPIKQKNDSDKEGGGGGGGDSEINDRKKENVKEVPVYSLVYKSRIGLNESQDIFVYDDKNLPRQNINVEIVSPNNFIYLLTDSLGKISFIAEEEGFYTISVPYPNSLISAQFEVVANYISSSNDFVALSNSATAGRSSSKSYAFIWVIIFIVLFVLLALGAYFFFKPNKDILYDFSKSNYTKTNEYNNSEKKGSQFFKDILNNLK